MEIDNRNGYVNYEQVECYATRHYKKYGTRTDFLAAVNTLYEQKEHLKPHTPLPPREAWSQMSAEDFIAVMQLLPVNIAFWDMPPQKGVIFAESIMPTQLEVYALRYVRDIVESMHTHNFFEVNYVISGSCKMVFENETRFLKEGELCIIAPNSSHDVTVSDDSQVVSLMLRQNTFETTFFKLLAQEDLLASFLRNILYSGNAAANYLLFSTDNSPEIIRSIRDIFMECHLADNYSNTCVISRVHLFFSLLLRGYSDSIQFYENQKNLGDHANFTQLLQYIQNHAQTLTLESLADTFHYNPSYLSRMIKKNTGQTLVEILTNLRISRASDLLIHTDLKVEDIAKSVGYDSADHFSRQFKKMRGMAPRDYRISQRD